MGEGMKRAVYAARATTGDLPPAWMRGLRWFCAHGEVALFDTSAPSRMVRKRLEANGLIETCGKEVGRGALAFTRYRISAAGLAALKAAESP
jgi:hypothetical protein